LSFQFILRIGLDRFSPRSPPSRDGNELTGYSNFRFQSIKYLVDAGLKNGDVLISVCDIPAADIFGGDYKSWPEVSFCCAADGNTMNGSTICVTMEFYRIESGAVSYENF
jgi:hypothetical protein